jgi:hypothetical protein
MGTEFLVRGVEVEVKDEVAGAERRGQVAALAAMPGLTRVVLSEMKAPSSTRARSVEEWVAAMSLIPLA